VLGKGDVVGGRYRLGNPLGEGGAATVFQAKDLTLDRRVAVKLLFAKDERQKDALAERFLREAKISAAVQHQHVISIVDFGISGDDTPYMVMELLEGILLADRLSNDVVLTPMEAIEMGALVLRGLGAVHRAAIVHRDLKPENIFLVEDGDNYLPKILDFGISRSVDPRIRESAHTTKDGLLVGTPDYMSPEQVRGLPDIDTRTDIYSMGVILYEAVAGRMPFETENVGDLMILVAAGDAPEASVIGPWVPEPLSKVIARAMARKREDRYQTTREMLEALIEVGYELDLNADVDVTGPFKVLRSSIPPPPRNPGEIHEVAASISRFHDEARKKKSSAPPTVTPVSRSPTTLMAMGAGAVLLGLAIAGAVFAASRGEPTAELPSPTTTAAPPQSAPAMTDEVVLAALPDGATIRVDGAVTPHPVVVVRDQAPHVIEVTQAGHEPWRVTHVASGPAEYTVELHAREIAVAEPADDDDDDDDEARERRRRRREMAMEEMAIEVAEDELDEASPRTFRSLDY